MRDSAGGRLPSVAPKIHFNLVSGGAHWAQPSAEALASRTGKLKGETKRRTAAEMLDCQV